jgi:hypothetical protein
MSDMIKTIPIFSFSRIALKEERGQRFKGLPLFLYLLRRSGKRAQRAAYHTNRF